MAVKIILSDGTEVTLREPKVKDMRIANDGSKDELDIEIKLVGNLTEMSPDEVDDLTVQDYNKIAIELRSFLE